MKILIVTVYNSHNSGSFLQAHALMSVLTDMGHEVKFLKREIGGSTHDIKIVAKRVLRSLFKFRIGQAYYIIREWFVYDKAQTHFPIVSENSKYYSETDCIILGSDTIWNFDSKVLLKLASTYLGSKFKNKHVISYAASAANTPAELFNKVVAKNGCLSNIDTILVRDFYTKGLVEQSIKREAYLVTDPTLIASKHHFDNIYTKVCHQNQFVLLYFFGEISESLRKSIQEYAIVKQLDVISMPMKRSWCNKSLMSSPQNMVTYFHDAQAIITDTFHGTAFSMIYEKPFAVYDAGKNKVRELLIRYGEDNRLFTSHMQLSDILNRKNEVVASGRLENIRNESITQLKLSLMKL